MFFRLRKINLLISLIFLSLLLSPVYSCTLTASNDVQFYLDEVSGDEIIFTCAVAEGYVFYGDFEIERSSDCLGKTITLKLLDPLVFIMSESIQELEISGVDVLELNGKDITVNVENNETITPFVSTFLIDVPLIKQSNGNSEIKISEKERPVSNDKKGPFGIKFQFTDINVSEGAFLNINLNAGNGQDDTSTNNLQGTSNYDFHVNYLNLSDNYELLVSFDYFYILLSAGDGINGGKLILEGNDLNNFGSTSLLFNSGHGGLGNTGSEDKTKNGGRGGTGGSLEFYVENILNYGSFNIDLNSGYGGKGGIGSKGVCTSHNGWGGGFGGHGGLIFLDINNIINFENLSLNVLAGSGGIGGKGGNGKNCDSPVSDKDPGSGRPGGHGGIVYIDPIYIMGVFLILNYLLVLEVMVVVMEIMVVVEIKETEVMAVG